MRYYEAIEITVNESGIYTVVAISNTNVVMPIYIYKNKFYSGVPFANLLEQNDYCYVYCAPQITIELLTSIRYILVVTHCQESEKEDFMIRILGRSSVSFRRISK